MPFPDRFVWGVASAAYQVEGAHDADGKAPSVWDQFAHTPGKIKHRDTGDHACNSYHRSAHDAELIGDLGAAYRFSVSWPRVLPTGEGGDPAVNKPGLDYYDRLVDQLLEHGVTPYPTLFHWDLPLALHRKGGWLNRDIAQHFADYARILAERLGDRVKHWMTFNEPSVFMGHGYRTGIHAPGLKLPRPDLLAGAHHVLLAHGLAVRALREAGPDFSVGWAPTFWPGVPATNTPEDIQAARDATFWVDPESDGADTAAWWTDAAHRGDYPDPARRAWTDAREMPDIRPGDMELIATPVDFLGVNTYSGFPQRHADNSRGFEPTHFPTGFPRTAFDWAVVPEALYWGPKFLAERYNLPIYITENGLASTDWVHADGAVHDPARIDYLHRHLAALKYAVDDGVDVRAYFQWSVLDNFEWGEGYGKRFGLVYVDFLSAERLPKDSYHWYKRVIETNGSDIHPRLTNSARAWSRIGRHAAQEAAP